MYEISQNARTAKAKMIRLHPYMPPMIKNGVHSIMESQLKIRHVTQHFVLSIRRNGQKKRTHIISDRKYKRTRSISSGTCKKPFLCRRKKIRLKSTQEKAIIRARLSANLLFILIVSPL